MAKSRKVSSISKEFDGKEIQGKLIERSGLLGSKVSKEVFKMPGGGKHIEKTRTNKKGDVVSRLSRDTKVNPLKLFNDNKQQAYKKAGGEMSAYKKSLKKAQDGMIAGPYEEGTAKYLDTKYPGTAMKFRGPVDPSYEADQRDKVARPTSFGWDRTSKLEAQDRSREEEALRSPYGDFNTGMGLTESDAYKRGGRVKKPMMKKGGSVKKMSKGGALKPVPSDKVGLSKLPTPVRNKMGYQKKGGSVKRK
jgi:hypothetical protein